MFWLWRRDQSGAFHFSSAVLLEGIAASWKIRFSWVPFVLRAVALTVLAFALTGPRTPLEESKSTTEGIDIVLALDVSGSMAAEDFMLNGQRQSRLEVIKNVVKDFIKERHSDRIALVAFGGRAYTVCPPTTDYDWLNANLDRLHLGVVEDGTAIGSGLSSALARLKNSKAKSRIIILLTDGGNNAGKIDPMTAAQAAKGLGVKIYTIGAGTTGLAPFPVMMFGRKVYQNVRVDLEEEPLKEIARLTGAQYFRATDTASLKDIYKEIDRLEKTKIEQVGWREYREMFAVFTYAALALLLLEVLLANTIFLKIP